MSNIVYEIWVASVEVKFIKDSVELLPAEWCDRGCEINGMLGRCVLGGDTESRCAGGRGWDLG
jgi:hypothetical protein